MATLRLGDAPLTRIGLGTNRLKNTPENVGFVRDAVAAGVGVIDTAHSYTGGESEQTIGAALSSSPDRCVVATKGGWGSGRPEALRAEIEESLRRLGTNTIDLYKPSKAAMNQYGSKKVNIKVVKWGSFSKSVEIMKPRTKYPHIKQMVQRIERSS